MADLLVVWDQLGQYLLLGQLEVDHVADLWDEAEVPAAEREVLVVFGHWDQRELLESVLLLSVGAVLRLAAVVFVAVAVGAPVVAFVASGAASVVPTAPEKNGQQTQVKGRLTSRWASSVTSFSS